VLLFGVQDAAVTNLVASSPADRTTRIDPPPRPPDHPPDRGRASRDTTTTMPIDFLAIAPEIALTVTALLVLPPTSRCAATPSSWSTRSRRSAPSVAIVFTVVLWGQTRADLRHVSSSTTTRSCSSCSSSARLLAILGISWRFFAEGRYFQGEYYFLLLTASSACCVMPSPATCCCCSSRSRPCRSPRS
jgi:hypothetical protein